MLKKKHFLLFDQKLKTVTFGMWPRLGNVLVNSVYVPLWPKSQLYLDSFFL